MEEVLEVPSSTKALKPTDQAEQIRAQFADLLSKADKENPKPEDIQALSALLYGHKNLRLWESVYSVGYMAELVVLANATKLRGTRECWRHRLKALRDDLGYETAPMLEKLLIQQAALCWLKLSIVELTYEATIKQSITIPVGLFWEKRLTAAQSRFTRACEALERIRKLSRNTPALQVNIATDGGQQVNVSK